MRRVLFPLAVLAAVLAVAASPGSAIAAEHPLKLRGTGQLDVGPTGAGSFEASGVSTLLGSWTNEGSIQFVPGPTAGVLVGIGEVTFTAANGDTLHMTIEGVLDLSTGVALATFTADGGTGRFTGAEGEADSVILQNPDGSFAFTLKGVIDN
jgi:hypothetical protein